MTKTTDSARAAAQELKSAWGHDPDAAWAGLNELFRGGAPPEPPPDGDYAGELLATRTLPPLDALARAFDRRGLWWLGKAFDADRNVGENRLDPRFRRVFRVIWPLYRDFRYDPAGELRALHFQTRIGPGLLDPDRQVLKIDYSACRNPFLARRILDELIQLAPGYYLGKAHFQFPGGWRTVAFFALGRPG